MKADQFDATVEAQHQTSLDIQQSLKSSLVVESKTAASASNIDLVRATVSRHLKEKESPDAQVLRSVSPDCAPSLDVGTVRLLNDARKGIAGDPAVFGDGESQAPSAVGQSELIDNDLQIIGYLS